MRKGQYFFASALVGLICAGATGPAKANTISISNPFIFLTNVSDNPISGFVGTGIFYGADATPNPSTPDTGTTAIAVTRNTATNALVTKQLPYVGNLDLPDRFYHAITDNPDLHGLWTLEFTNTTNTTNTANAQVTVAAGAQQIPFVNSVTVTGGSGLNPTISWTAPLNTTVNGYRVNIYDGSHLNAIGQPTQIFTTNLAPTVTAFTVPNTGNHAAGDVQIAPNSNYYFEIDALQTRDGSTAHLGNPNIADLSRVFLDFRTTSSSSPPTVYLPVATANGSYAFNMQVTVGQTYYIDPAVATGYVYKVGANDPNFASVTLPTLQAAKYDLSYIWSNTLFNVQLAGGVKYDFQSGGVDQFTVTGIDPTLGLDPTNPTAFVTGLTFVSDGTFTGTQTPITSETPLPTTLPLFAAGLGVLGLLGCRRKRKNAAVAA